MMISTSCTYGIQAAIFLAGMEQRDEFVSTHAMGEALGLSPHFLAKVLQRLIAQGLVQSKRGPNGGVALARPAGEVSMKDIVLAIDGSEIFEECVLGLPGCGDQKPCPLHDEWGGRRSDLLTTFEETSIALLAEKSTRSGLSSLPDFMEEPSR